jgi:hypothetical protein
MDHRRAVSSPPPPPLPPSQQTQPECPPSLHLSLSLANSPLAVADGCLPLLADRREGVEPIPCIGIYKRYAKVKRQIADSHLADELFFC